MCKNGRVHSLGNTIPHLPVPFTSPKTACTLVDIIQLTVHIENPLLKDVHNSCHIPEECVCLRMKPLARPILHIPQHTPSYRVRPALWIRGTDEVDATLKKTFHKFLNFRGRKRIKKGLWKNLPASDKTCYKKDIEKPSSTSSSEPRCKFNGTTYQTRNPLITTKVPPVNQTYTLPLQLNVAAYCTLKIVWTMSLVASIFFCRVPFWKEIFIKKRILVWCCVSTKEIDKIKSEIQKWWDTLQLYMFFDSQKYSLPLL